MRITLRLRFMLLFVLLYATVLVSLVANPISTSFASAVVLVICSVATLSATYGLWLRRWDEGRRSFGSMLAAVSVSAPAAALLTFAILVVRWWEAHPD